MCVCCIKNLSRVEKFYKFPKSFLKLKRGLAVKFYFFIFLFVKLLVCVDFFEKASSHVQYVILGKV